MLVVKIPRLRNVPSFHLNVILVAITVYSGVHLSFGHTAERLQRNKEYPDFRFWPSLDSWSPHEPVSNSWQLCTCKYYVCVIDQARRQYRPIHALAAQPWGHVSCVRGR